jgi:hypothetical protein
MYVEEDGSRFVKHHLIDFASTLGAGANGPSKTNGMEYGFDGPQTFARMLTLGFYEDDWRKLRRPEGLPEVGYFDVEHYDPKGFKPQQPNSAFARMTDADAYWAAKIISAFSDEQLEAVCATGKFRDPRAAEHIARGLAGRRDVIAREFFAKVCPVDFFRVVDSRLVATDLGVERGIWPADATRYRVRTYAVNAGRERSGTPAWREIDRPEVAVGTATPDRPFFAAELQVDRGDGWGPSVVCYVAPASGRVVAVDR